MSYRRRTPLGVARAQAEAAASGQPLASWPTGMRAQPRKARNALESAQGRALIQWADLQVKQGTRSYLKHLRHIPNGGARDKATAGKLKAEGVRRGTWDYNLALARQVSVEVWKLMGVTRYERRPIEYCGLWIELKIETERRTKNGGLSDEQRDFGIFLRDNHYATVVAYDWDEARQAIEAYCDGKPIPFFWCP